VVGDALTCARDHLAGEGIGRAPAHNVKLALRVKQIDGTKCYMTVFLSSETYGNDASPAELLSTNVNGLSYADVSAAKSALTRSLRGMLR
jgi:hypothetical protein